MVRLLKYRVFPVRNRGFTLIELLVTIAVIGVMATAVVMIINPPKHIADARDSNRKIAIADIVSAMESCYTLNEASWTVCSTITDLVSGGFLKQDPTVGLDGPWSCSAGCVAVQLENPPTGTNYWKYDASAGKADYSSSDCGGSCH